MIGELASQIDRSARRLAPFGLTVLLITISVIRVPIPGYGLVMPSLGLMSVYYWAIHRPDLMPAPAVLLAGLLEDILTGAPTGINGLVYLLVFGIMRNQRRPFLGKPFTVMWFGFVIVAPIATLAHWLLVSALDGAIVPLDAPLVQLVLMLALYPWLSWLLSIGQRAFLRAD